MIPWIPKDLSRIPSPSILVCQNIVEQNIREMIRISGNASRLRPHVKTHKTPQIVEQHLKLGISKFKCATTSEAKMLSQSGAPDILIAYPIVGPSLDEYKSLILKYPNTKFSLTCDSVAHLKKLDALGESINVFLDIDVGMGRTGCQISDARDIIKSIRNSYNLKLCGIHAYDGHIHDSDLIARQFKVEKYLPALKDLISNVESSQGNIEIVCGGSPTFEILAKNTDFVLSPGTTVLWDAGYSHLFPELQFKIGAVVLARVIHTNGNSSTLDMGTKAVASEMAPPRVTFPNNKDTTYLGQSEEHMMISTKEPMKLGQEVIAVPWHICPTVALHDKLWPVENGEIISPWQVSARTRNF